MSRSLMLMSLLVLLAACGQKGDLYLPDPEEEAEQTEEADEDGDAEENDS